MLSWPFSLFQRGSLVVEIKHLISHTQFRCLTKTAPFLEWIEENTAEAIISADGMRFGKPLCALSGKM